MTDRELLTLAAKAGGIELRWFSHLRHNGIDLWPQEPHIGNSPWNPLTNDGDALRLAVRLRIEVEPWIHGDSACARAAVREVLIDEPHYGEDPERATRRAIVRAAAEIGRSKT